MAYAERHSGANRAGTILAVGAVHAAIGAALIYGFAPEIVNIIRPHRTTTFDVPTKTLPPPPPKPVEQQASGDTVLTAPPRPFEFPTQDFTIPDVKPFEADIGPIVNHPVDIGPVAPPFPHFTPKAPSPANSISRWVTPNDYPSRDLRMGHEGVTGFRVAVGTDGRVKSCEIVSSSGYATLDDAVCDRVSSRARFTPATNGNGEKIVDTFTSAVRWEIPD